MSFSVPFLPNDRCKGATDTIKTIEILHNDIAQSSELSQDTTRNLCVVRVGLAYIVKRSLYEARGRRVYEEELVASDESNNEGTV